MVPRSVLVYELLKNERTSIRGLSEREILKCISEKHNIFAGKVLKKQITLALKRGIDFGIIKKRLNKYRFEPEFIVNASSKNRTSKRKRSMRKFKRKIDTSKRKKMSIKKKRQIRKRKVAVSKPKLPSIPSSWTQEKRDLRKEPIPRLVKHR